MLTAIMVFVILIFTEILIYGFMAICLMSLIHDDLGEISSKLEK
jgi:hypothetical protein